MSQSAGVNVRPAGAAVRAVLPEVRATLTVTSADGRVESFTAKDADSPWRTGSCAGAATRRGPRATVMPTGADSAAAPWLSYALA